MNLIPWESISINTSNIGSPHGKADQSNKKKQFVNRGKHPPVQKDSRSAFRRHKGLVTLQYDEETRKNGNGSSQVTDSCRWNKEDPLEYTNPSQ